MKLFLRQLSDKLFTLVANFSIVILVAALFVILWPMLSKGFSAVIFKGTVEFREMQFEVFHHGDEATVQAEVAEVAKVRQEIWSILEEFERGIDVEEHIDLARSLYRDYKDELRYDSAENYSELRDRAKDLRDVLCDAYEATDEAVAEQALDQVLAEQDNPIWADTHIASYFEMARSYRQVLAEIDLARRDKYTESLGEVQAALHQLLGPAPWEDKPELTMDRYGATRWDLATKRHLQRLLYHVEMVPGGEGGLLVEKLVPRREQFAGSRMVPLFDTVEQELEELLRPRWTFYWRYFFDDSTAGHYFGGVGPEILGTLLLTGLAMLFAVPLGVISAAYLVECAGDNMVVKMIRTCVNTLAGVPSIVFGLFGLAFFVRYVPPMMGQSPVACILTASMTLAVLVLPLIIRASEEAMRNVPQTYKEASLALGAGRFRTFVLVTLPAASSGILTGIILSLSRAAGETAPIIFTGAAAMAPMAKSLWDPTRTLSYGCYDIAVGDRLAMMVPHKQYGMVATLIVLVLCLNVIAIAIRSRMAKKMRGS